MACQLLLLVFALSTWSVSAVFEIIDCGSSQPSRDGEIYWLEDFTQKNGFSRSVPTNMSISHVMNTLRVFTTRKKNCYSFLVDKGDRVLVRAGFYYGNYDGKSSPPAFDLQFDGNDWVTVNTSMEEVVSVEVIYVAKGDRISVCVAQTMPNQYPFINTLEMISLDADMYSYMDQDKPLFLETRIAYGTNETVRYSEDLYYRIWQPSLIGNSVQGDVSFIYADSAQDKPPEAVLRNARTTLSTSLPLILTTELATRDEPVHINLYFSEVTSLDPTQLRSFTLQINNETVTDPILPLYAKALEVNVTKVVSTGTTLSLVATSDSTLPPLINAMEVFTIGDQLTDGTNSSDVEGLALLQDASIALQDWSGDPCLPAPYTWDWINCSSDAIPRVTALYLGSFDLFGTLPDFSSMDALETIDLHNNSLSGIIPDFLGRLPNLKVLNLADNQWTRPIPASLLNKKGLNLILTGNPDLCPPNKSCQGVGASGSSGTNKKSNNLALILGITIPSLFIAWAIIGVFIIIYLKNKRSTEATNIAGQNGGDIRPSGTPQEVAVNPQLVERTGQDEPFSVELADQTHKADHDNRNV